MIQKSTILNIIVFVILFLFLFSGCTTVKKGVKNKQNPVKTEKNISRQDNIVKKEESKGKSDNLSIENGKSNNSKNKKEVKKTNVIEEKYKKQETLSILDTIKKLEKSYEDSDFELWESLLTPAYKEKYNDPTFLKKHGWNANDLKSFFQLLIETREENGIKSLPISRVEFVSPRKAYVYVIFKGKEFPKPQHTFIKIGNSWYKGLPDEGE